ncbi:MAG TPA: hypothetical protein VL463_05655 [Kofleriaceae bacterium]|nr:hypothetical protein [Kofleriaceae bacterium]
MLERLIARLRSWLRACRRLDVAMVVAACALVGGMYCTNSDWGGDPNTPRGDGQYRPVLARGDGHLYYLMARSTVLDGDWVFDNDLARFGDPWAARTTPAGRKAIPHPIGPALVWAPVLATAQGLAWTFNLFGAGIPMHGYTGFHQRLVFATTVLFAWLAIVLGWCAARRWVGGRWGPAFGAVSVLLGTSLAYYATYMPSYPHAMDAAGAAVFLHYWATTTGRADVKRFVILGALLGLATLIRSQELALGVVVAIEVVSSAIRDRSDRARALWWIGMGAIALAVALACFAFQLYEWKVVYGSWGGLPQGPRFTRFTHPQLLELLWSSRNGWLSTTPVAYLGVIGLAFLPKRHRLIGAGLIAVVVVQAYLCSTVFDWWSSASFGQRRLVSMSYPLVIGLAALCVHGAALARRIPRKGRFAIAIVVLGWLVVWNMAQVFPLRGGKPAPSEVRAMCCDNVPPPMRWIAQPVYRAIGNPFALPASAWFAVKHGVGITRWDRAAGAYALVPGLDDLTDGSYVKKARGTWNLGGGPGIEPWLIDGFGASVGISGGPVGNARMVDRDASALVPALLPDGEKIDWWMKGPAYVAITWNGSPRLERDVPDAWTKVTFDVPADVIRVGMNTVEVSTSTPVLIARMDLAFLP